MKLELKHLSPYLPYRLKGISYDEIENTLDTIIGLDEDEITTSIGKVEYHNLKPILHPLSDLTKEIEVNGERFVPIEKLYYLDILHYDISLSEFINLDVVADHIFSNQFIKLYNKLCEWHFDIFGLIENNLAIDINTL